MSDRLSDDHLPDASNIQVEVKSGEVTLNGHVESRTAKRHAEDCIDNISGVSHVQNNLRVDMQSNQSSCVCEDGQSVKRQNS